ncbi:MAG: V-type ATP synthase subunit D [Candidatus Brocadiae bacterium]|nr:V-type ATP synthase subunit D [Candidatus Brocadiia bacterium]
MSKKKIKFTRNELKAQRESLARFNRFLPTLELKKMLLQLEKEKVAKQLAILEEKISLFFQEIEPWEKLLGEACPRKVTDLVHLTEVITDKINIAGIFIPVFKEVLVEVEKYDQFLTPPWYEKGIEAAHRKISLWEEKKILQEQEQIILMELRKTTQRINLFRERLIPECKENIRQIRIYLGDMQAAAVGRAKIAKQKNKQKE